MPRTRGCGTIHTWREGVHTLNIPRMATHRPAPRRPTHAPLPQLPDAPALTALLAQLTYWATSFARLGCDFRTPLLPLFKDAVRARVSGEFARAAEEFRRLRRQPEAGLPSEHRGRTRAGVLRRQRAYFTCRRKRWRYIPPLRCLPMRPWQH